MGSSEAGITGLSKVIYATANIRTGKTIISEAILEKIGKFGC